MTDPKRILASLAGEGLEIGAFYSPLAVGPAARVKYVDFYPPEVSRRCFPEAPPDAVIVSPDILSPADALPLDADSQDFVLTSHLLEHLPDPIRALKEWHRVLRPGGTLFLKLPDQRGTFDRTRERTSLAHLVKDHAEPPAAESRRQRDFEHFREWARCVNDLVDPAQIDFWARLLVRVGYPIHYHCWQPPDIRELLTYLAARERTAFDIVAEHSRDDLFEFTYVVTARK